MRKWVICILWLEFHSARTSWNRSEGGEGLEGAAGGLPAQAPGTPGKA